MQKAPMLAAQVIGASADTSSHTLFINRGEGDHMRRNMGVITPEGIVGKIVEVFPATARYCSSATKTAAWARFSRIPARTAW